MPRSEASLLGAAAPDFPRLFEHVRRIQAPDMLEQVIDHLVEELVRRAESHTYFVNAMVAAKGRPEDAATLGQAMMAEAERVGLPDLAAEGQCWLLVAGIGGHPESRKYLDEYAMSQAKSPSPAPAAGSAVPLRAPRQARGPRPLPPESQLAPEIVTSDELESVLDVALPAPSGPGRVVLKEIGDPKSKDGLDLSKRFRHVVGAKMPYGGEMPAPGELKAAVLARWPWATDAARFVEGRMAVARESMSAFLRLPPMIFVGPTGSGKTTIGLEISAALGLPATLVSCGGVADSGGLAPTARGWNTSRPCGPFMAMAEAEIANPTVVLDELDKGTPDRSPNGSVWASALSMLEKSEHYHDNCLMAQVDLSAITFMATANDVSVLPPALLDRFHIVRVPRPRPEDFPIVLKGALTEEAKSLQTDIDLLPAFDRHDVEVLRRMFGKNRNSLRTFRKIVSLMLGEKAMSAERQPRLLN